MKATDKAADNKTGEENLISVPPPPTPDDARGGEAGTFMIPPPAVPTQEGPLGIRYDFNYGARVLLPKGQWRVRIEDDESGNILFECDADEGWVLSKAKYYVPFKITVWQRGVNEPVLEHVMDLRGKEVLIQFLIGALGDIVGWIPYAERFRQKHNCITECFLAQNLAGLFSAQYPELSFTYPPNQPRFKSPYATYRVCLFLGGVKFDGHRQPIDYRYVGYRSAAYILGVDPKEEPARVALNYPRSIKEPYVCIAAKSTRQAKFWNNNSGWAEVIKYLKEQGYRVLCIDKDSVVGQGFVWNAIPQGAEDFTGNIPLEERVALLQHADFFIGLASGLSWLAWAAKIPVILISGFSLPTYEFETPYRVFNTHGCNGCYSAADLSFNHYDFFFCPRHKNTPRQFECTRLITGRQVIGHIKRLMADYKLNPKKTNQ